jgi:integrase/recombinase XerD
VLITERRRSRWLKCRGSECRVRLDHSSPGSPWSCRGRGYKPQPVGKQLGLLAALSGWLAAEGAAVSGLSSEVAERFCAARRAAGYTDRATVRALDPLLGYLRGLGVAPLASSPAPAGPVEELLAGFRQYLEHERGLVPAAARGYVDKVRPFVARFNGPDGLELWRVDVAEVRGFVVEVCPRLGRRAAPRTVVALRALLRFLHLEGVVERSLAGAVPSVASWRLSGRPMRLERGLRAGEVAALSLEDIDWRAGELIVRGKGARSEGLPLPHDVGETIVGYLRDGRPATAQDRAVFVRVRAPHHRLSPGGVTFVVAAAARRAGLGQIHAHRLRHTAASEMLRCGATLPEVRCCVTAARRPPRSTPRSTARRSDRSRVRGRERSDERAARLVRWLCDR